MQFVNDHSVAWKCAKRCSTRSVCDCGHRIRQVPRRLQVQPYEELPSEAMTKVLSGVEADISVYGLEHDDSISSLTPTFVQKKSEEFL